MKNILRNIASVVAGFASASGIMMLFEYVNSKVFPFPEGFDTQNIEQVRVFAETMPWTAYILVFIGWMLGAFIGSYIMYKILKSDKYTRPIVLGVLLSLGAIVNYMMLQDNEVFYFATIPLFFIVTVVGFRMAKK